MVFLCDFDGTITKVDVVDTFLEVFADREYLDVEERWLKGEISSLDCLSQQVSLVKDIDKEKVDYFLESVEIDEHFKDFVEFVKTFSGKVFIISDGFRYFIEKILDKHGIKVDLILSNELIFTEEGLKVEFPYYYPFCSAKMGNCKCKFYEKNIHHEKLYYIGDGRSDFCVATKVEKVFAKGKLYEYLKSVGKNVYKFENFKDIIKNLQEEIKNDGKRTFRT
ncbi:MAG: MtnX-like HAD-IB family phosphatase [Sulfurihydrogenibium sp.]